MQTRIFLYLVLLSLGFLIPIFSFAQNIKFEHISDKHGLPQGVINCVYQDSKGFIWFGTQNGLARYDGYQVTVYQSQKGDTTSLSNNVIRSIVEDQNGVLWIGTMGGGLNAYHYDKDAFKLYKHNPSDPSSLSSDEVLSLLVDENGTLWIGTRKGGLCKYIREYDNFRAIFVDTYDMSFNTVNTLLLTKNKELIGGGDSSTIYYVNRKDFSIDTYQAENGHKANIRCMEEGLFPGVLWIGTRGSGVLTFDMNSKKFSGRIANEVGDESKANRLVGIRNTINDLLIEEDGKIWIATQEGLSIFDPYKNRFKNIIESDDEFGLSNSDLLCIFKDKSGSIWMGSSGGGVNVYHKKNLKFQHFKKDPQDENSIKSNVVFSFLEDSDSLLWVGTYEGGLTVFDRENETSFHMGQVSRDIIHNTILALHEDKDRIIWIGYYGGGIQWYDKKSKKIIKTIKAGKGSISNNTIFCFNEDSEGNVWIGNFRGLDIFIKETGEFIHLDEESGLSNNVVTDIVFDNDYKTAWISTLKGGINRLEIGQSYEITKYPKEDQEKGISNNRVNALHIDFNGDLWVATNNGLNRVKKGTTKFEHFFKEDGLPDNYIYGILPDDNGNIWLSTNKGISRLKISDNITYRSIRNYGVDDALQDNEFNQGAFYRSPRSGELLFGGVNGYNSFFPEEIIDNPNIPEVFITSIKCFDEELVLDSSIIEKRNIVLSHKQNYLSFEFVGLDYFYPSKNQYSFMLEGVDEIWHPATNRRYISYPNLEGGDYVFKVRASNSDGIWNIEGKQIHIRIIPPFWKTKWFYSILALSFLGLIWLFFMIRTKAIKRENRRLELMVADRTKELESKNNDITSSIQYAKRLQEAILPSLKKLRSTYPDSFVMYKPKDIVSGDFYWFAERKGKSIITASDCTGHGVPGAFMSMLGINLLNSIVIEGGETRPDLILNELHTKVIESLGQSDPQEKNTVNDGMDMSIVSIDKEDRKVQYAGAYNPLFIFEKSTNSLKVIKADKLPIGSAQLDDKKERIFTLHEYEYSSGDQLFMFSDGFVDQFGGESNKKYKTKNFKKLLLQSCDLSKKEQHSLLERELKEWMGDEEQIDDVLIVGISL